MNKWNVSEMLEKLRKNKWDVYVPLPLKGSYGLKDLKGFDGILYVS